MGQSSPVSLFACQATIDRLRRNLGGLRSEQERCEVLNRLHEAEIARIRTVSALNLQYLRRSLAVETFADKRENLLTLIAEEEARLSAFGDDRHLGEMP